MGFFYVMENLYKAFLTSSVVCTDTRNITKDCIFFCLKGANFDGNTFAHQALEKGAKFVVVDDVNIEVSSQIIKVDDVLESLQNLATFHRNQFKIPIIGITGSNGKTTSKELISAVLSKKYKVLYTNGNLNNHIGVPLTLLQLSSEHEIAVIEMGANKPGDIKELVEIALPTHGIITNVGRAHLEGFGSLEGVIRTKTEMYEYLKTSGGVIFVNEEDTILCEHVKKVETVVKYNSPKGISGELITLNPFVEFRWMENEYTSSIISSQLIGKYNFMNFLAAISIGRFFKIDHTDCSSAIAEYQPTNNRSQVTKTKNNTLIVDCYNANPTSMRSALESFALIDAPYKIVVLGDMREMGNDSELVHKEIIDLTIELRLSGFFIGEEFFRFKGAHPQAVFLKSVEPLIEHFEHQKPTELLILLKGSRGIQIEKVIPYL